MPTSVAKDLSLRLAVVMFDEVASTAGSAACESEFEIR